MTKEIENKIIKKRGRKPKNIEETEKSINKDINKDKDKDKDINDTTIIEEDEPNINITIVEEDKPLAKKRGRKPKGGKIIQQIIPVNMSDELRPNVILHLKCSLKDLQLTMMGSDVQSYTFENTEPLMYNVIHKETEEDNDTGFINNNEPECTTINSNKEVWKKLKILEHNLHINNISDKKSACFWCTCEFDNPPVYIPKFHVKNSYQVYGCFCSPECATAFLMDENIDSSSKFERYYLLNHIYSKIYDYKKNIKPAPNPYYMLDKYYGNLTIQEYRSLLRNERLFLIVDKPLTRILPELHEDNDDFIISNKIIPSNSYQIKKKLQKKQVKSTILSERFGLSQHQ